MYQAYFGLTERPFSIAPDPQYLYMSSRHQEAMAHLSYGLTQGGCFIVLTGEVGTGKTTLCRNLLSELPDNLDVALILNANINEQELLQTICDELKIDYQQETSQKQLLDLINQYLLETFAQNRHTVLIIDEAQLLSRDVLEQIRLLTNLETTKSKLLQIILIGQPELNDVLSRNDLRQLAQRVTARYHLGALRRNEIEDYIHFRLSVAGCKKPLFSKQALSRMHSMTEGIPRRINVLADHALLAAYSNDQLLVDAKMVKAAAKDVFIENAGSKKATFKLPNWALPLLFLTLLNIALWWFFSDSSDSDLGPPVISSQGESDLNIVLTEEQTQAELQVSNSSSGATNSSSEQGKVALEAEQAKESPIILKESAVDDSGTAQIATNSLGTQLPNTSLTGGDDNSIQPGVVIVAEELLDYSSDLPDSISLPSATTGAPTVPKKTMDKAREARPDWNGSDLAQLLETSADVTGAIASARQLASYWQVDLPEQMLQSACDLVRKNGLACLGYSSLEKLQLYNRPGIVVLSHNDQLHRAIVESIDVDTVNLKIGSSNLSVNKAELKARWAADGILYWRPDQVGTALLQEGSVGVAVFKVRGLVNRALNASNMPLLNSVESSEFDLDMSQKVFALQSRFGITTDSKIGDETYMLMNEIVSPDATPVIRSRIR